jgi:hypothetical protein
MDTRVLGKPAPQGSIVCSGPLRPHSRENVGGSELGVISIELKNPDV